MRAEVTCATTCDFGLLLGARKSADGWTGLYAKISAEGLVLGSASLSPTGKALSFVPVERQGTGFGRTVQQNVPTGPPRASNNSAPRPPARAAPKPRQGRNRLEVFLNGDTFSASLNGERLPTYLAPVSEGRGYGPVAIASQGQPIEIHFLEVRDGLVRTRQPLQTGGPFTERRLSSAYLAEAVTFGDFDKDGVRDVASGPYWFRGPEFTEAHEVYLAPPLGPMEVSSSYQAVAFDFSGDGYDDLVQAATPGQPGYLYLNPGKASQRWTRHLAFEGLSTETLAAGDLDGDGKPELVFGQGRRLVVAKPDATDVRKPWTVRTISSEGWVMSAHGTGIGDIDGDGRPDLLVSNGWWRQPKEGIGGAWTFHAVAFGNVTPTEPAGATAQMYAYDVDGDGLNDVVTALEPHGWGIGWFKQVRSASEDISFVRHEIMGSDWSANGKPVFSQPHAMAIGDVDGDGLTDIVAGKRWWAHRDGDKDPDPNGPAVVYWFKLVRLKNGEVRFEPRLINNDSGVGTSMAVGDLNRDGRPEVMTANRKGVFVFLNRR